MCTMRAMNIYVHSIIEGRVQGVGYRAWTSRNAQKRGLTGWVRNRRDGTVEAVFCGPDEVVQAMLEECQSGPLAAKVRGIETTPWDGDVPTGFTQLPTL